MSHPAIDARVEITSDCVGTGQCVVVSPELFRSGDDGLASVQGAIDSIDLLASARRAADLCPMAAIRITFG